MRDRSRDVVRVQSLVEADAFRELLDAAIRRLAKDARPCFFRHRAFGSGYPTLGKN